MRAIGWRCLRCDFLNTPSLRSLREQQECENCEAPRDWEYDGPDELGDTAADTPAVRAEQQDRARRLK